MNVRQASSLPDITKGSTLFSPNKTPSKADGSPVKFRRLKMQSTMSGFTKPSQEMLLTPIKHFQQENKYSLRSYVPLFKSTDLEPIKMRMTVRKIEPPSPPSKQYSLLSRQENLAKPEIHNKLSYQNSHEEFYNYYRNMQKIRQQEKDGQHSQSPLHTILRLITVFNLPPKTYELIKQKGDEKVLELARLGLGRSPTLMMIGNVVDSITRFKVINLSENDIGPEAASMFIPMLSSIIDINFSFNNIGMLGIKALIRLLKSDNCSLKYINLEKNSLNDKAVMMLVEALRNYRLAKRLNFSQNFLSFGSCQSLKALIKETDELQELYLHWCQLDKMCGQLIFEGLTNNKTLKVLDMSWNKIGGHPPSIAKLNAILQGNGNLVHVDLAYCQYTLDEAKNIAESIEDNNTLTGFHFDGNPGRIDRRGYLHPQAAKKPKSYPSPIKPKTTIRRINSIEYLGQTEATRQAEMLSSDICWICMGWQEIYFRIDKQLEDEEHFVHLSVENYASVKMVEKEDWLQLYRMVPQGQLYYFFSVGKEMDRIFTTSGENVKEVDLKLKDVVKGEVTFENVLVKSVHYQPIVRQKQIFNEYYEYLFKLPIRAKDLKIIGRKGLVWANSFFRSWKMMDNKRAIEECLNFDIKNSKIMKVLKKQNDFNEVTKLFRQHYLVLRNVFTLLASRDICGDYTYGISSLAALNFGRQFGYIARKFPQALYTIKFITSLTKQGQKLTDPNKLMTRSSFIQFLIRLAEQKYVRGKWTDKDGKQIKYTMVEGVRKIIQKLLEYDRVYNFTNWRVNRYWNEDNDRLLKIFKTFLEPLYEKYAGSTIKIKKKGERPQLSLDEFKQILTDSKININNETETDLNQCFDLCRWMTVEEGDYIRKISFLEFAQALARFADRQVYFPIGYTQAAFSQYQISIMPLSMKFEGLLFKLLETNRQFSNPRLQKYTKRSIFTEQVLQFQFVVNKLSPFNEPRSHTFISYQLQNSQVKINSLEQRKIQTSEQIAVLKFELQKEDRLRKQALRRQKRLQMKK